MPIREEQLEQSMHAAAPRVDTNGVLDRVAQKRARRRTMRRVELGALAAVLVVALSTIVVLAQDDGRDARVAAPGGTATARVITGPGAVTPNAGVARAPVPVALDADPGYVRGPLVVSGSTLSLAAYDHRGDSFTYPPSRIVQLDDRTFQENGRTNLQAEILSIADADGARWVVTRNPAPANGLPDAFLKRIGADGTVTSTLLPPGTDVVGPVAVGPDGVWVPVRDGVLRYDPAVDRVVSRVDLPPAGARWVVIYRDASFATDGSLLRRLVPAAGQMDAIPLGPEEPLVGIAQDGQAVWAVLPNTVTGESRPALQQVLAGAGYFPVYDLPRGFAPTAVFAAGGRVWVEGTADGSPAVVLLGANARRVDRRARQGTRRVVRLGECRHRCSRCRTGRCCGST